MKKCVCPYLLLWKKPFFTIYIYIYRQVHTQMFTNTFNVQKSCRRGGNQLFVIFVKKINCIDLHMLVVNLPLSSKKVSKGISLIHKQEKKSIKRLPFSLPYIYSMKNAFALGRRSRRSSRRINLFFYTLLYTLTYTYTTFMLPHSRTKLMKKKRALFF